MAEQQGHSAGDGYTEDSASWLQKVAATDADMAAPLLASGTVVAGRYRVEAALGRGGMGVVYRATHTGTDKQVALKVMARAHKADWARRFSREAKAMGRIEHPNVVTVFDSGVGDELAFLAMELLDGAPLSERLRSGPMAPREAASVIAGVACGVGQAHRQGIVHRDLKPANIMLLPGAGLPMPKVLDFGLAVLSTPSSSAPTDSTITREGTVLGTPAYMPLEQFDDVRVVDARADVYALGVTLFQCLSGQLPFSAETYSGWVLAIGTKPPRSLAELAPDVPVGLVEIVQRAMSRVPGERYADANVLHAALQRFLDEDRSGPSPRRPLRGRRWAVVLAAALTGLSLWAFYGMSDHGMERGTHPPTPIVQPPPVEKVTQRVPEPQLGSEQVLPGSAVTSQQTPQVTPKPASIPARKSEPPLRSGVRTRKSVASRRATRPEKKRRARGPDVKEARPSTSATGAAGTISLDQL